MDAAAVSPSLTYSVAAMAMLASPDWVGHGILCVSAAVVNIADVNPLLNASQMAALNRANRTWSVYSETAIPVPSGGQKYVSGVYAPNVEKLIFAPYIPQYFGIVDPLWNTSALTTVSAPHTTAYANNYGYIGAAYCPLNGYVYAAPFYAREGVRIMNPVNNASWSVTTIGGFSGVVYVPVIEKLVFCPRASGSAMVLDPRTNAWSLLLTGLGGALNGIA